MTEGVTLTGVTEGVLDTAGVVEGFGVTELGATGLGGTELGAVEAGGHTEAASHERSGVVKEERMTYTQLYERSIWCRTQVAKP